MAKKDTGNLTDEPPKVKINKKSIQKAKVILSFIGEHKWKFYIGLFFLLLTSMTALAFPKLMGILVNTVNEHDADKANKIGLLLAVILILQSVFSFFRIYLFENVTQNTLKNVRQRVYANLIKLPMSYFAQKRVGELNSRMSADLLQLQDTLTTTIHCHSCSIFRKIYSPNRPRSAG